MSIHRQTNSTVERQLRKCPWLEKYSYLAIVMNIIILVSRHLNISLVPGYNLNLRNFSRSIYAVTLRATTNGIQFQGFLVQLRSAADQSIIGEQLVENSDQIQQHACTPATGGFTHVSPSDKDYITFQWTPRAGTGDVVFR